jgi:hypothetical protein
MEPTLTHRIRERAYEIWAASGCPNGEADLHWLTAEREILTTTAPKSEAAVPEAKKSRRPGRSSGKKSARAVS